MKNDKQIIKSIYKFFTIAIILLPVPMVAQGIHKKNSNDNIAKKIIYETDMCADVDDVGGLAILHAMANNGEAELLAVCFNEVHPSGAAAIDAINTWYGRGNIPIGIYRGTLSNPDNSNYLEFLTNSPHDLENTSVQRSCPVDLFAYIERRRRWQKQEFICYVLSFYC
ncbi:MAG: hypothetical protein ACE5JB_05900 [bacterium]